MIKSLYFELRTLVWILIGAAILGGLFLKAIFNPKTKIYRCPKCALVIKQNSQRCGRCRTRLTWGSS